MASRILIDCDGVLADLVAALCGKLADAGFRRTADDFKTYNLRETLTPEEWAIVQEWAATPGFCSSLDWYPGAKDFVRELRKLGDVVCVTAPWLAKTWDSERRGWLKGHIEDVISLPPHEKAFVAGDVLIEDRAETVAAWVAEQDHGDAILMDRPWNRQPLPIDLYGFHCSRAHSYEQALAQIRAVLP